MPDSSSRSATLVRYGTAIFFVALALGLSFALRTSFGNPAWFFFPASVIASTWVGGRFAGALAVVLSTLAVQVYFVPPYGSFSIDARDLPYFLVFIGCGVGW